MAADTEKSGIARLKKEHTISVQGQQFVRYEGLLWAAHEDGLKRVSTTLIQIPGADNSNVAIVAAEVETNKGTFSGIGDASPANVGRMIAPHIIRMAETRAKARALRDAVNIGVTAIEELGDSSDSDDYDAAPPRPRPAPARRQEQPDDRSHDRPSDTPKASPYKAASANQLATISKLSRLLGEPEEPREDMTSAEASERITDLSREYNERKGVPATRRGTALSGGDFIS